ncbi:MAG: hypothetical protein AAB477_01525 [Patescibacteria group bacterium]
MHIFSKNRSTLALFIIIIIGVLFSANLASALSLSPARIEISGNPGESLTKEVTLINENDGTETYYSSFANFEASGDTGNPSFVVPKNDIGTWMNAPSVLTLKPKESKIVNLSINIPKNAEPGGHFGAIFFGNSPSDANSGVSIGAKTGILVLLSVSGDVKEAGGLVDFNTIDNKFWYNTLPVSFTYRFKNDGGDRIKPVGKIVMHDLFYIPEDKIDANPTSGNILPSSTRRFEVNWIKNPNPKDYVAPSGRFAQFFDTALYQWHNYAFGPYMAKMDLLYGTEALRATKNVFFFVFPWQLLIFLAIIFIIVFWGGRKLIKRYNRHIIKKARAGMSMPNDTPSHV